MSDMINIEGEAPTEKKKNGKPVLILIVATTIIVLAGFGFYLTYEKASFVKTNNASVQCDMITIASKISGDVLDVKVKQGSYVNKGDIIMELEPTVKDGAQIDNSYIRAPIDGIILKSAGTIGQSVTAGQTVAYITNGETNMYITANIDEKSINKISIGQDVDITIDQFGNERFYGKVVEISTATLSAFSVVPSSSSGTFVKTTQNVPIKIQFIENYDNLLVGANANVSIHLK